VSIWSSLPGEIVGWDSGGVKYTLDVATATSWNETVRLTVWREETLNGAECVLDVENAETLIASLREALNRIERTAQHRGAEPGADP
jgi:hypothetical protein